MTTRRIRARSSCLALALLVLPGAACGDGAGTGTASARPSSSAAPKQAASAKLEPIGAPCGVAIGRQCSDGLTCVKGTDGAMACLALPRGAVCGSFQCKADEACCDPQRSECSRPGVECEPRVDVGRVGSICREGGCDPGLECVPATGSPFGVCVTRP